MLIAIDREKEQVSFVDSAKGFLWLQNQILSGILSIIIYKADGSIVFVVVKLKPVPKRATQEQLSAWGGCRGTKQKEQLHNSF